MKVLIKRLENLYSYFFKEIICKINLSEEDKKRYLEYRESLKNTIEKMKEIYFYQQSVYEHAELNSLSIQIMRKYIENLDKVFAKDNSMDDVPFKKKN